MRNLRCGASCAALALAFTAGMPAFAQSTGSIEFDQPAIIVTGTRTAQGVGGVVAPDTQKTRQVLTSQFIQHQTPGQSINDVINQMPGVSFQNNDPYGSAGGTLTIRGFDSSRISETWDGIPLNDTGNYALYSNQLLDPELIDQVNVSLGSTDIDSPTAAASGSTVNFLTRTPTEDFHARLQGSVGEFDFFRVFGVIDTGTFTKFGTRAWIAASHAENTVPFNHFGKIDKQQYNAKIYQPIGDNGDFISVAGHFNRNRNNFFGSVPLRTDLTQSPTNSAPRVVGTGSGNRFPRNGDERDYTVARCVIPAGVAGVADKASSCGTSYDERYNPSDTGNIRVNSRFSLTDRLTLTVDPYYEYTKANGGGTATANEGLFKIGGVGFPGYFVTSATSTTGQPYAGVDLNGDGDLLDQVTVLAPSTTRTNRFGVIANLRYDFSDTQTVRVNYTLDYGRHRQTGEVGLLQVDGRPRNVFPLDNPVLDVAGNRLEKRDRFSKAILNQVSGEYRGEFFDDRLVVIAGIRAPFFQRKLDQRCFTYNAGGGVTCFAGNEAAEAAYAAANPNVSPPQKRNYKFDKILPSAGLTFQINDQVSVYASYAKGLQVPGTDNLYNAFYFERGTDQANPKPETTDNFDAGVRYRSGKIQAQLAGWYTNFKNRLASSYDPEENVTVYRNLGTVHKYGIDGSVSYTPIPEITLYAFGSYLKSKILDDVQIATAADGSAVYALTKGKRESGSPTYTFGGRIQGNLGPLQIGIQAKRTGKRYVNDQNTPVYQCLVSLVAGQCPNPGTNRYQVYGAAAPAYTIVDLDARLALKFLGLNDQTYFQLNVTNLFDKFYVGGFGGTTSNTNVSFVQIGAPRAISGTVVIGF